jgi:hypothetical protein
MHRERIRGATPGAPDALSRTQRVGRPSLTVFFKTTEDTKMTDQFVLNRVRDFLRSAAAKGELPLPLADVGSAEDCLRLADKHLNSIEHERSRMPDPVADPNGHARAVCAIHAHVKTADCFLEGYRLANPMSGDDTVQRPAPEPEPGNPKARAQAGVFLAGSGNLAEAERLVAPKRRWRH